MIIKGIHQNTSVASAVFLHISVKKISTLIRFLRLVTSLPLVRVKVTWIDPENSELDFPSPRYVFMLTGGLTFVGNKALLMLCKGQK